MRHGNKALEAIQIHDIPSEGVRGAPLGRPCVAAKRIRGTPLGRSAGANLGGRSWPIFGPSLGTGIA